MNIRILAGILVAALPSCGGDERVPVDPTGAGGAGATSGPGGTSTASGGGGLGGAGGGPGSGWRALPPLPGGPRQETAVVELDGEVWVLGGFDGLGNVVDTVEVLDPGSSTWRAGPDLPTPMHHANVVVVDGRLLVLGFLAQLSFEASGDTFVWDPESEAWAALTPLGRPRGASAVGALSGGVIVCGGFRDGAVPDCDRYDPSIDVWAPLPDLPAIRDHVVGAVVDDRFFVVGGREGTIASIGGDVWELDLEAPGFVARRSMRTPRAGAAAAVLDGRILVAGGEGNPDDPSGVFPQLEAYDPVADTWTALPDMPTPRHGTGAAVVEGMLVVPGGADVAAFSAVDVVEGYVP